MRAIEAVADLGALSKWACEYHIASEALSLQSQSYGNLSTPELLVLRGRGAQEKNSGRSLD